MGQVRLWCEATLGRCCGWACACRRGTAWSLSCARQLAGSCTSPSQPKLGRRLVPVTGQVIPLLIQSKVLKVRSESVKTHPPRTFSKVDQCKALPAGLFWKAAELGNCMGALLMGHCYRDGKGVGVDGIPDLPAGGLTLVHGSSTLSAQLKPTLLTLKPYITCTIDSSYPSQYSCAPYNYQERPKSLEGAQVEC